jgi:hypothetical protein
MSLSDFGWPACKSGYVVHICVESWSIPPLCTRKSPEICPHTAKFAPRPPKPDILPGRTECRIRELCGFGNLCSCRSHGGSKGRRRLVLCVGLHARTTKPATTTALSATSAPARLVVGLGGRRRVHAAGRTGHLMCAHVGVDFPRGQARSVRGQPNTHGAGQQPRHRRRRGVPSLQVRGIFHISRRILSGPRARPIRPARRRSIRLLASSPKAAGRSGMDW